jgi:hypothetical protein
MSVSRIPQGPWYNPELEEGVYDAKIMYLTKGTYGAKYDPYTQIVLCLPKADQAFVTNLYFPEGKPDSKTVERLSRLCQCIGLLPQDVFDSPHAFHGAELRVQIKRCKRDGREYWDVDRFLHAEAVGAA